MIKFLLKVLNKNFYCYVNVALPSVKLVLQINFLRLYFFQTNDIDFHENYLLKSSLVQFIE